ncbi:MAG: cysteine hydrolase family protein [Nitrospinota bacterium]
MPQETTPIELDAARSALMVVDMQNDYCSPGGDFDKRGIPLEPARKALPNILRTLDAARTGELFVVYTAMVYDEFTFEDRHHRIVPERMRARNLCRRGSWGAAIIDELSPRPGEPVIEKCRYSGFYNTNLEILLRNRGITTLILAGVVTNVCVESTARDAFQRDFDVIVVSDATASYSPQLHEAALLNVRYHCGAALSTEEVLRLMAVGAKVPQRAT